MLKGLDASMDCSPYSANMQSLGVSFVGRYYTNLEATKLPQKVLTPREAHYLSESLLKIVVVWELLATAEYFSKSQGQADGIYAFKYAAESIRQPLGSAIYFAVDFDASLDQFKEGIIPYFKAISDAFASLAGDNPSYSIGVYGSGAVCAALKQMQLVKFTWLSRSSGWQGSQLYQDWDIRQGSLVSQGDFQFDEDLGKADFGAFSIPTSNQSDYFQLPPQLIRRKTISTGDTFAVQKKNSGKKVRPSR
jgi:hypothetical protein